MRINLDCLNYDISDSEESILKIIAMEDASKDNIQSLCYSMEAILGRVFASLDNDSGMSGWTLDDFQVVNISQAKKKVTLCGEAYWLDGGQNCDLFQFDIAKDTKSVLYSYKFNRDSRNGGQVLYIGKTYEGWIVNA